MSTRLINLTDIVTGQKTVAAAGTPERVVATSTDISDGVSIILKAKTANTGSITVGNSSANALNTGTSHFRLAASESISFQIKDLRRVWIDATVNDDGVEFIYER